MVENELVEALQELRAAVLDLKSVMLDTNHKMAEAMNGSHIPSAVTAFNNAFEIRDVMDMSNNPKKHRHTANYF